MKCGILERMLGRVLHVRVGFVIFIVHGSSEEVLSPLIVNMVGFSSF